MKLEHLGEIIDMDSNIAALEVAILRCLKRHGPLNQPQLYNRVAARNYGVKVLTDPVFLNSIERLVQKDLILRSVTRRNGFLLRLPPREKRQTQESPCLKS